MGLSSPYPLIDYKQLAQPSIKPVIVTLCQAMRIAFSLTLTMYLIITLEADLKHL